MMEFDEEPRPPAQEASTKPVPKAGLATLVLHHSITALILILFLALGVWGYLTFRTDDFFASVDRAEFEAELRPPLVEAQRQRLVMAIEVANLLHGQYPRNLEELVEQGLLQDSDLYYPRGREQWVYNRFGDGFTLDRQDPMQQE